MEVIAEAHAARHRARVEPAAPATRARGPRSASRWRSASPASAPSARADLSGRRVAVIGLGSVGGRARRGCSPTGGARLVVADVDQGKRELADELGADWTDPDAALTAEVDVLAPCALGGVLNDDTVPALRCRAIAGAANNQLAADAGRRAAGRARDPVGAGLRRQRRRDHQHRRRARARAATRPSAPTRACAPSATRCARSSTTREAGRHDAAAPPLWSSAYAPSALEASGPRRAASPGAPQRDRGGRPQRGRRVGPRARRAARPRSRRPASSAASSLRSRSRRWARYSSSLAGGSLTAAPWPGQMTSSGSARRRRSAVEVLARGRSATNTLPSPSTASPVKQRAVARRTRGGRRRGRAPSARVERAEAVAVAEPHVGRVAARGHLRPPSRSRSASTPSAWSAWSWVSAIPPAPPRASTSAATASRCVVDRRARDRRPRPGRGRRPTCSSPRA